MGEKKKQKQDFDYHKISKTKCIRNIKHELSQDEWQKEKSLYKQENDSLAWIYEASQWSNLSPDDK